MRDITKTLIKETNFFNRLNGEVKLIKNDQIREAFLPPERFYEKTLDDKKYVIDKNSTSTNALYIALDSYKGPIILIAGGVYKKTDYSIFDIHKDKIDYVIDISKNNVFFEQYLKKHKIPTKKIPDINKALHYAKDLANPGYTILVSPGHPSFDLSENNEDRTNKFIEALWEI